MISLLCVDDDPDIQLLYKSILSKRDYHIRVCGDGTEAITAFMREPSDLVLLDMEMPRMSGIETCSELRRIPQGSTVPIIIVSSRDDEEIIFKALSHGADDYILKPFKPSELLGKVSYALKRRKAGFIGDIALSFTDKYEIVKKLDEGGQTTVYFAQDNSVEPPCDVALKIFKAELLDKGAETAKTLFLREAYEWSKLNHPNIVRLHDFGQASGSYFLALEFVDGPNLWDKVDKNGPVDEACMIKLAIEMTSALQEIAKFNMVHRDIKPNNIMLSAAGDAKLTDFGLAKQPEDSQITAINNVFKGTPDFVSPEQVEGHTQLDIRTDIYSLGVTLYYAGTSSLPFRGNSIIETLNNHFSVIPDPLHVANPIYSEKISEIVGKMMKHKRDDRYSVDELASELEKLQ